jgi:hypothetical protein
VRRVSNPTDNDEMIAKVDDLLDEWRNEPRQAMRCFWALVVAVCFFIISMVAFTAGALHQARKPHTTCPNYMHPWHNRPPNDREDWAHCGCGWKGGPIYYPPDWQGPR